MENLLILHPVRPGIQQIQLGFGKLTQLIDSRVLVACKIKAAFFQIGPPAVKGIYFKSYRPSGHPCVDFTKAQIFQKNI